MEQAKLVVGIGHSSHRVRRAATVLIVGVALAGCGSSSSSSSTTSVSSPVTATATATTTDPAITQPAASTLTAAPTTVATPLTAEHGPVGPAGDAFFTPPEGAPGAPGTLIWSRPFTAPQSTQGYTILYWSRSATGQPIAVSGVVIVPLNGPASDTHPVLAWAHGTAGMDDSCAPSRTFAAATAPELAFAPVVTQTNAIFVATDYEGLGTKGDPAYLVGRSEGQNVLDSIRALTQMKVGVTLSSPALVWGHSQGGGAAAWAAELAPTYAADLKVVGSMLGAPAAELGIANLSQATDPSQIGYGLSALAGLKASYPELSLDDALTAKGKEVLDKVRTTCAAEEVTAGTSGAELVQPGLASSAAWRDRITENNPGQLKTTVPMLIYHGDADTTVPVQTSQALLAKYCALGDPVQRKVYPGKGHVDVIAAALNDLLVFAGARWQGTGALISSCSA